MAKKLELDARKVLEILNDDTLDLRAVAEKLGCSPEAVDEARCLSHEIDAAEVDAILAMPSDLGRALLRAASQAGRHDVLVAACAEGEKEVQREAKRIAHNLKLRGVDVALPVKPPEAPRPAPDLATEPPVYLSSLDSFGERAVFWTRALPGRGIELAQLVVSDERGVIDLILGELSRKRFRELTEELPRRGAVTIREVSREEARTVLDRARAAARLGGQLPGNFPAWAAQVLGPAPVEAPPPIGPTGDGRSPQDPVLLAELVAESASLFAEPELSRWAPDEEALRSCAKQVEEAAGSPLHVGDTQRQDAVLYAVERAAEAWFDDRRRAVFAARLLDTGRMFETTGRIHAAQVASATARALAAGMPTSHIPFTREIFARLFLKAPAAPAPASSVLVEPDAEPARAITE